jgi:hypothetical protein
MDEILASPAGRAAVLTIDPKLKRGNARRFLHDELRALTDKWDGVPNKAWYSYIVYENLHRLGESQREARGTWAILNAHGMTPDEGFWREAHAAGLYPTAGLVRGLVRHAREPELPRHAALTLDYSVSEKQMFRMTQGGACEIKIGETEWMGYQVTVPSCVDSRWNGRMSKPRFLRTRDGRWECLVSLELDPDPPVPSDDGVLGLDLGLVKPYSASAVYPDGRVSQEQVESRRLSTMQAKLSRLKDEKARLYAKYDRSRRLRGWQPKPGMDASYAGVKRRITRLKHESAVQVSREIVEAAQRLHCGVVHAERLSWLDSWGGRWDHSAVQTEVEDRLSRAGVRFERVSAAYSSSEDPVTGERGRAEGRDIVYGDGTRVDRDRLAGVNLACRPARGGEASYPRDPSQGSPDATSRALGHARS